MALYKDIFLALNHAKVRYLVAGGVAVNLHGVERATADLDLILHLEESNLLKFAQMMTELGYQPKVPVKAEDFANEQLRESWIKEKNMLVFSFVNLNEPMELIDIFVRHPLPFDEMYNRHVKRPAFGIDIPILSIEDLILLKRKAGRPKDLFDLSYLEMLQKKAKK